jgi:hypothetical protein
VVVGIAGLVGYVTVAGGINVISLFYVGVGESLHIHFSTRMKNILAGWESTPSYSTTMKNIVPEPFQPDAALRNALEE